MVLAHADGSVLVVLWLCGAGRSPPPVSLAGKGVAVCNQRQTAQLAAAGLSCGDVSKGPSPPSASNGPSPPGANLGKRTTTTASSDSSEEDGGSAGVIAGSIVGALILCCCVGLALYFFNMAKQDARPQVSTTSAFGDAPYSSPTYTRPAPSASAINETTSAATVVLPPGNPQGAAPTCCICLDEPANHTCVPCGHKCYCASCAETMARQNCAICRQPVTNVIRVYE